MRDQTYNQIKNIINNSITNMLQEIDNCDIKYKTTILKKIINESISEYKTGTTNLSSQVSTIFSGRGRAWAKTIVDDNNIVWNQIKYVLNDESLKDNSQYTFEECTNLLDVFENSGFAWMRFGSVSNNKVTFHLRVKGSKSEERINLIVCASEIFNGNIENLDGVPHRLGLEPGVFINKKINNTLNDNKIVSKEELNDFGIQLIEDLEEEFDS